MMVLKTCLNLATGYSGGNDGWLESTPVQQG
ncbi:hypothetical protein EPYR_03864 [Erwinia pyrifoliae DSM 12163]|nr:hypothetical protein EPYR_03864 [Erwinia pyrifoliae DSM 12163]